MKKPGYIKRRPLQTGFKPRGGQQIVQPHGQSETILGRKKNVETHHPDTLKGWGLNGLNQTGQIESLPLGPDLFENIGQKNMFPAGDGIRLDAEQGQQARRRGLNPFLEQIGIGKNTSRRRRKSTQHTHRRSGV